MKSLTANPMTKKDARSLTFLIFGIYALIKVIISLPPVILLVTKTHTAQILSIVIPFTLLLLLGIYMIYLSRK